MNLKACDHINNSFCCVNKATVAVVIPCYKVTRHIKEVIEGIGDEVSHIYIVDDACPHNSGQFVKDNVFDSRVHILIHTANQGVGGAVMTGYIAAIEGGADIIIKVDGDGQMDPALIPNFIWPIVTGRADYVKGNRFYDLEMIRTMPAIRLFGNAILSLMAKLSTGYWNLFDPTNGYTAIHAEVARHLPYKKISKRYFFETDMLFRLNTLGAVVVDIPMNAKYEDEVSNLRISKVVFEFLLKHARNFLKRIFYNYYLRNMSIASIEFPVGLFLTIFGTVFGCYHWIDSAYTGVATPLGTIMLSALPILVGVQFLLGFFAYDISSVPVHPIHHSIFSVNSNRMKSHVD